MPLRDVSFEGVVAEGVKLPLCAYGEKDAPFTLTLKDVSISFVGEPAEFMRGAYVEKVAAENLKVEALKGPFFRTWGGEPRIEAKDVRGVELKTEKASEPFRVQPI